MKKYFYFLFTFILNVSIYSQTKEYDLIINADKLSKDQLYSIHNNGWAHLKYRGETHLINFSNKDYILHFNIYCKNETQKPSYLIEYGTNYKDGGYRGIDFTSSKSNKFKKVSFFIDKQNFENPFLNYKATTIKKFVEAIKNGKTLSIKFFNNKNLSNKLELEKELQFMLKNGKLLDEVIDCK